MSMLDNITTVRSMFAETVFSRLHDRFPLLASVTVPAPAVIAILVVSVSTIWLAWQIGTKNSVAYAGPLKPSRFAKPAAPTRSRAATGASSAAPGQEAADDSNSVVVVGGGIAGISAGFALARQGRKVTVVERDLSYQDRIVGELLQPGGVQALTDLGLGHCLAEAEIDSVEVFGYALFSSKDDTALDGAAVGGADASETHDEMMLRYPLHAPRTAAERFGVGQTFDLESEARAQADPASKRAVALDASADPVAPWRGGPVRGRSFHHGALVQRLRQEAAKEPNLRLVEGVVTRITEEDGEATGVMYKPRLNPTSAERFAYIPSQVARRAREAGDAAAADAAHGQLADDAMCEADSDAATATARIELGTEQPLTASLVVLCDGIWSALRKHASTFTAAPSGSASVGVVLRHPPQQPPVPRPGYGHVVLARPCPLLIYQISSTETRVLAFAEGRLPPAADGSLDRWLRNDIAPQLPGRTRAPFLAALDKEPPKSMPNRDFSQEQLRLRRCVLAGDANNMRHPLTGGGMTVALCDVRLLTHHLSALPSFASSDELSVAFARFRAQRAGHASTINVLANALFAVFTARPGDAVREHLRKACYAYLARGGACTAGPMGLLSGITHTPTVLVSHFFAVAFYSVARTLAPFPTPAKLARAYALLRQACVIIMPLLKSEKATPLASTPVQLLAQALFMYRK